MPDTGDQPSAATVSRLCFKGPPSTLTSDAANRHPSDASTRAVWSAADSERRVSGLGMVEEVSETNLSLTNPAPPRGAHKPFFIIGEVEKLEQSYADYKKAAEQVMELISDEKPTLRKNLNEV